MQRMYHMKHVGHEADGDKVEDKSNEHEEQSHKLQAHPPSLGDFQEPVGDIFLGDDQHDHYVCTAFKL